MYGSAKRWDSVGCGEKWCYNHIEGNGCLVSKRNLYKNVLKHCALENVDGNGNGNGNVNISDIVPTTFIVKGKGDTNDDVELQRFVSYTSKASVDDSNCFGLQYPTDFGAPGAAEDDLDVVEDEEGSGGDKIEEDDASGGVDDGVVDKNVDKNDDKDDDKDDKPTSSQATSSQATSSPATGSSPTGSLWILKPASSTNRGSGILMCSSPSNVIDTINRVKRDGSGSRWNDRLIAKYGWVLQKYMESPYLINCRKFDLRVFVLYTTNVVTGGIDCWFYKEFYVRTSGVVYNTNVNDLNCEGMHLTNDAIQKKKAKGASKTKTSQASNYGKYEEANKLSMAELSLYLTKNSQLPCEYIEDTLSPQLKGIIKTSYDSVKKKLNPNKRKYGFELLGYDFMLTADLKPYLIEVNSNPCLEMPCPLLTRLISEVLEATFLIGVDDKIRPKEKDMTSKGKEMWEEGLRRREECGFVQL
jgi:hypothetical protein